MNRWDYFRMFREPSTYAGIAVLLGLFGVQLAPEQFGGIVQAGSAVAGTLAVFMPERRD